jgi:dTDP-4-amino-4,6-dideoxygalactose transaminase
MTAIPFNFASPQGDEYKYVLQAIESGQLAGDGPFTKKCHEILEETLGIPKALLTTSCTHALEMSAMLLDIRPGDEVIVPDFTFVSTVNAFVLRGAKPVFIDVRPDTLNMDETRLEELVSPSTRAIVPVHYAGVGCEMDTIMEIANRRGIPVVEDNAHGLFGKYKGKYLGTFGSLATQSFHSTKNITCGEGGALLINHETYLERAEILREKGTNRSRFFRGQVDKYTWTDIGSSYLPSEILAAFLCAQLERWKKIQQHREQVWKLYEGALKDWAHAHDVTMPHIPDSCEQSFHMFYLLMPSLETRQNFIAHLKRNDINAVFHYLPLHLSDMGGKFGGKPGDFPVTEEVSDRLVRLPFYNTLTPDNQERIIEVIHEFEF